MAAGEVAGVERGMAARHRQTAWFCRHPHSLCGDDDRIARTRSPFVGLG